MSEAEQKLKRIETVVQNWVDKQGHERCWHYPDLFKEIANILDVKPSKNPALPPLDEFKKGCERYQKEEYNL